MKTVVVVGGAGFIGSHLCARLLMDGYRVICIDNLITGNSKNIEPFRENDRFTFIHHDVTVSLDNISDFSNYTVDYLFHLASPASPNAKSPRSYIALPLETLRVNSLGTQLLLEFAKRKQARFLYASTSEVYGNPQVSPQSETYWGNVNPNGVRSVYDEAKRFGEAMVMAYVRKYAMDCRIVRIFNTYGPHMQVDDGRVVSNFITQAIQHEPLTIYGEGKQTRSFCYVSDMIEGLCRLMFVEHLQGEVVNIGNPHERTILDFAAVVKTVTSSSSELIYEDLPQDDPLRRCPDIAKARKLLGWEPIISLEEGIKKTVEYFKTVK